MAFLTGSGRPLLDAALVTEKEGKLWIVDTRSGAKIAVAGVPAVHVAGQGGLGDVAVNPEFVVNHRVYLSYVEEGEGGNTGAVLGYGTLDLADRAHPALRDFKVIWRQQPKLDGNGHFSHRIAFGPDGFLYLTSGERQHFDPAQDLSGNLGKVLQRRAIRGPAAAASPHNSGRSAIATCWASLSRPTAGCGEARWGRRAAMRST
jgi:glucose/arabinose dehydrogenase